MLTETNVAFALRNGSSLAEIRSWCVENATWCGLGAVRGGGLSRLFRVPAMVLGSTIVKSDDTGTAPFRGPQAVSPSVLGMRF